MMYNFYIFSRLCTELYPENILKYSYCYNPLSFYHIFLEVIVFSIFHVILREYLEQIQTLLCNTSRKYCEYTQNLFIIFLTTISCYHFRIFMTIFQSCFSLAMCDMQRPAAGTAEAGLFDAKD